ncbi:MAG: hypothetical protein FWG84_00600 [Bacteroidales bacterium]|nr:hypothetical protein [Bacteroidales bacterium]
MTRCFYLLIISIILCFVLVFNILGYRSNIANGITGTEIKKIKMGMTLEEVISILGKPYEISTLAGLHNLDCKNPKPNLEMDVDESTDIVHIVDSIFNDTNYCCEGNEEDIQRGKRVTLTYTKPVRFSKYYPMLWIHLDSTYRVWNVFAKRYAFLDDLCIYSLSWKNDETTLEEIPGEINLIINEEIFSKCFSSKK